MAKLALNQNQFDITGMLGQVTMDPQPNTLPAQLNPSTAAAAGTVVAGTAVKLIAGAGPQILVDVCTGPTDGPVFGFIAYDPRKNIYVGGDLFSVVGRDGVLLLESSAAIARGARVAATPAADTSSDPTVATDATTGHFVAGTALGQTTGAGQLLKVQVLPNITANP